MKAGLGNYFDITPSVGFSDSFRKEYERFTLNTPYNSAFAFFHKYSGKTVDGNFGNNCIALSMMARKEFSRPGDRYIYLVNGRHRPLVYQSSSTGNIIFLDPYLLHKEPIALNDCLNEPMKTFRYPVFPESEEHYMELMFDPLRSVLFQRKLVSKKTITFEYDLNDLLLTDPDPYREKDLYHNEQDNLSIRIVHSSLKLTVHLVCELRTTLLNIRKNTPERNRLLLISGDKFLEEGMGPFKEELIHLESKVGASKEEIVNFLKQSVQSYVNNLPFDLSYERENYFNPSNI